jgi:hypothetical protein
MDDDDDDGNALESGIEVQEINDRNERQSNGSGSIVN